MSVLLCNARSLRNKFQDYILPDIVSNDYDFVAITESWLNTKHRDFVSEYNIEGYDIFLKDRENKRGGGVIMYVKKSLKCNEIKCEIIENVDNLYVLLSSAENKKLAIGLYYRPPLTHDESDEKIYEEIESMLNNYEVIILGDFNLPCSSWGETLNTHAGKNLYDKLLSSELEQLVREPTRENNILDLVLTSDANLIKELNVENDGLSDHKTVKFLINYSQPRTRPSVKSYYSFKKANFNSFKDYINNNNWDLFFRNLSSDDAVQKFNKLIIQGQNKFIPLIKIKNNNKKPKWWSKKISKCVKVKKLLYKKFKRDRSEQNLKSFREQRAVVSELVRKQKYNYEKNLANNANKNLKAFFGYVNSKKLTNESIHKLQNEDGVITQDYSEMVNILNNYFSSVFTHSIDNEMQHAHINHNNNNFLSDLNIDLNDITRALGKIKINKSCGPDNIHAHTLSALKNELAYPLLILFKKSILESNVPKIWKLANVTPIFKKGDKLKPSNYRPISLTCILIKTLESIIREKVTMHLDSNSLIKSSQHGFRLNRSCVSNLIDFYDRVVNVYDENKAVDIVFLDFQKAFDKVSHFKLLNKLYKYGIQGNLHKWIKSWLSDRKQRVVLNGCESTWANVTSGVPQGSVLGPLLFLIFIDDIDVGLNNYISKFADDSKIMSPAYNQSCCELLQEDLNTVNEWANRWDMKFNSDKCKVMHIGVKNILHTYNMNDRELVVSTNERDLGVQVNNKLKPDTHINSITKQANRLLGLISRSFDYKSKDVIIPMFNAIVRPHLEYAVQFWNPYYLKDIKKLERVLKRATKLVPNCKHLPYEERLKKLNMKSLEERRIDFDLIFLYRLINNSQILDINNYLNYGSDYTRGHNFKIDKRRFNSDVGKFCFFNRVVNQWNKLPPAIVNSKNVNEFKRKLKTYRTGII